MEKNDIGREAVDAAIAVHRELGPGLLETVLRSCLSGMRLGYLLSFGGAMMKRGITREPSMTFLNRKFLGDLGGLARGDPAGDLRSFRRGWLSSVLSIVFVRHI